MKAKKDASPMVPSTNGKVPSSTILNQSPSPHLASHSSLHDNLAGNLCEKTMIFPNLFGNEKFMEHDYREGHPSSSQW